MRLVVRLLLAAAGASLPVGLALMSCGTGAVGVDACHTIEYARCTLAPACTPSFDVDRCMRFYRDECLLGIGNSDAGGDLNAQAAACVADLQAVAACVSGDGGCGIVPDAPCPEDNGAPATACSILLACPEVLASCAFVAAPDAGTADAADDGSDDGGDAATD